MRKADVLKRVQDTKIRFHQSVQDIAADLIALYQLQFKGEVPPLNDPLARWLDFRLRLLALVPLPLDLQFGRPARFSPP